MQGKTLKKLLKESGYTQAQFAEKLGVSRNYLLTLLDKEIIKEKYLKKASEILKVNYNVFSLSIHESEKYNHSTEILKVKEEMIEELQLLIILKDQRIKELEQSKKELETKLANLPSIKSKT